MTDREKTLERLLKAAMVQELESAASQWPKWFVEAQEFFNGTVRPLRINCIDRSKQISQS